MNSQILASAGRVLYRLTHCCRSSHLAVGTAILQQEKRGSTGGIEGIRADAAAGHAMHRNSGIHGQADKLPGALIDSWMLPAGISKDGSVETRDMPLAG